MTHDPGFHAVRDAGHCAVVRADLDGVPMATFWGRGTALPLAKGRGGAVVLELAPGVVGVARDFQRGGRLAFLFPRSYLDPRRPERELEVLSKLRRAGVPVVEPLAALARRRWGIFYELRLVTSLLEGARPLPAFVDTEPMRRRAAVREAGRVSGLAMGNGLLHKDLHPDNLIARSRPDGGVDVFLLDLDRAELLPRLDVEQRDRMWVRMARYLKRHEADLAVRPSRTDLVRFLAGAGLDREERRSTIRRLRPAYERALRRRGLL